MSIDQGMKSKYHIELSFKWFDFWVGLFLDKPAKTLYICFVPMFPIKIWVTEHETCPVCRAAMQKIAIDVGEGWALEWECKHCDYITEGGIEWPFDNEWMSGKDLERFGYEIV